MRNRTKGLAAAVFSPPREYPAACWIESERLLERQARSRRIAGPCPGPSEIGPDAGAIGAKTRGAVQILQRPLRVVDLGAAARVGPAKVGPPKGGVAAKQAVAESGDPGVGAALVSRAERDIRRHAFVEMKGTFAIVKA